MMGENDKSMLERFKEWLKADIKFTRKSKIKITELKEEIPISGPIPKLPTIQEIEKLDDLQKHLDELQKCREALDNGQPIYSCAEHFPEDAKKALENTFYKCGRNKEDIKILHEYWDDEIYVIKAVDKNTCSISEV